MHTASRARTVGFTLVELMVVVAIIAIVAAIAIPNLMSARLTSNETAAISNLRNIWIGQTQFQASGYVDLDVDGAGEAGFLREMVGATGVRTVADGSATGRVLTPSAISGTFRTIDTNGASGRSGYRFVLRLPDAAGMGVRETQSGAFSGSVDPDLAETTFCVYAWPSAHSATGNRTFFVNQAGDLSQTESADYDGDAFHTAMTDGMAFAVGGDPNSITGGIASGTVGRDGNRWRPIN